MTLRSTDDRPGKAWIACVHNRWCPRQEVKHQSCHAALPCLGVLLYLRMVMNAGRTAEEVISTEQLCQRRLENVRQLKELYEVELLNTMEEQRSRQSRSRKSAPGRV